MENNINQANPDNASPTRQNNEPDKFLPSFILGLIGSIFGIFGGFCTTLCTSLSSKGNAAFILIIGGSIVGLIGACQCLKKVRLGSILQLIAALMIIICAYGITGSDLQTVLAMLLFLFGGAIGLIRSFIVKK